jgi:Sin3 associated polypeptide p18 (SAP18)
MALLTALQVCPLLLRVFPKLGGHHRLEEFVRVRSTELDDEVQIYTWPDATLRELSDLVKEVTHRGHTDMLAVQTWHGGKTSRQVFVLLDTCRRPVR